MFHIMGVTYTVSGARFAPFLFTLFAPTLYFTEEKGTQLLSHALEAEGEH